MRRSLIVAVLVLAVAPAAHGADDAALRGQLDAMAVSIARYEQWSSCLRVRRAQEHGDVTGHDGYRFDAHDGTGVVLRPALAWAPDAAPGLGTYDLLQIRGEGACVRRRPPLRADRGVAGLRRAARRIERVVRRFDVWESCLVSVGVSEFGDEQRHFGFLYGAVGERPRPRAALAVDHTDPEDPDYLVLARAPAADCDLEAIEREPDDRRHGLAGLAEDVADLAEPVADMDRFDRCMFTLGVVSHGAVDGAGYLFGATGRHRMPALSLASGTRRAAIELLAFPSEEPPGIECDEDNGDDEDDD